MAAKGLRLAILAGLQILSGCTSEEEGRADAIAEVEKHCGLPAGLLTQIYVDRQKSVRKSDIQETPDRRLIRLGPLISPHILRKQECVNLFKSSNGFKFELKQISPYVIPSR